MEGESLFPDQRKYSVQTPTNSALSIGGPHMSPTRAPREARGGGCPLTRTVPTVLPTSRAWATASSGSVPPQTSLRLSPASCHPCLHWPQPWPLLPEPRHRLSGTVPGAMRTAHLWTQEGKMSPPRTQGRGSSPLMAPLPPKDKRANCQNCQETQLLGPEVLQPQKGRWRQSMKMGRQRPLT